ncbi:MAG: hypothetical protein U1A24_07550 [Cypionkella sp.]|uniref:hypothetical protein n=1 Tax=Cypionkella sp. TaxID=2811411 RepID=UPI002AB9E275|nr:hypothetical protein [Cypionkella sp.]MDZ4310396.1 hypothetical protein [Cypionkella sp.]MDZ4393686.1 hypothetical protein [Cypionkella sp.]
MKPIYLLFAAALTLAACGGNPFVDTPPVDPTDPTDPGAPVKVDDDVAVNLRSITYDPSGAGSLTMNIDGIVGPTAGVQFTRSNPASDIPGYETYTYQNRLTQRSFIAQVATNSRSTLLASAVSDGGQFNGHFGGGTFVRLGVYNAPTGTFSYAGTYAGIFAPGDASSDLPAGLVANNPYRVQGDALINASFVNNKVDGGVSNRWLLDDTGARVDVNADGVVDDDDQILVDIAFPEMTITANGQFLGDVQVSQAPAPVDGPVIGKVNGVFGGAGATDVAGAIAITPISGTSEHGVFNLPRCGLAGESPLCNPNPLP